MLRPSPALLIPMIVLMLNCAPVPAADVNLVQNADFSQRAGNGPADYTLDGDAQYRYLGDPRRVVAQWGVALESAAQAHRGSVWQSVPHIDARAGRWFRFSFRGLPQNHFAVDGDNLFMKVEYFAGSSAFDGKEKHLYSLVQQQRKDFTTNGDGHQNGAATWHTYQLDFMLPSPKINRLRLSVGFDHVAASSPYQSEFFVADFSLTRIAGADPQTVGDPHAAEQRPSNLIPIGGRWFYKSKPGETAMPKRFDYTNADRLIYHDNRWSAPFDGSMSAYLRAGDKDLDGDIVTHDQFVPDNVTVSFDATSMIIHSKGIPNHPTGKFPQEGRGNPNYIQEQNETYYIPFNPRENPNHRVTAIDNSNRALPMGPIGIAANGVVFFNPFDAGNLDASNIMDFCCGHPNQDNLYHYHKYPICINSPWADEGKEHSPLIGWAFDGFPIYGPYVKAGLLAKDATGPDALNAFNIHWDKDRGWHYQVTPGKFPYIIGGFWGYEDPRDRQRPHHPRGSGEDQFQGPPNGAPPFGGPDFGGPPPRGGDFPPP
jgi:YHYH protein